MKKLIATGVFALACLVLLVAGFEVCSTFSSIPHLFRRNAELKAMGYYVGEFEFKMISGQFYLSEGRYLESYRTLRRITTEMKGLHGLRRIPDNATREQQMAFLLDRQDPETGAFMDHRYPVFSYFAPTCNAVENLTRLSQETGLQLTLKHPLRFLDQINTPEQLRAYLDSLLYLGELAARFPGPGPYGPGVSELACFDVLEKAGVHRFSEHWKKELRRWFYETQDPETGFWGARIGRAGQWRQMTDINATFHVLKLVLTESGENQLAEFPLRHAGKLARGVLQSLDTAMPEDAAGQHDWGLEQYQGAKMLTKYLWPHLSDSEKDEVRRKFRSLALRINGLYRPDDGGFAYYTTDARADIDGTGLATGTLQILGVMPDTWERERIWGKVTEADLVPAHVDVQRWEQATLPQSDQVRSFRVYRDRLPSTVAYDDANLVSIVYPPGENGLDIMDLRQGFARFMSTDGPAFGNWKSKTSLKDAPLGLERGVKPVRVARGAFDLAAVAREHPESLRFYVVGYDSVQVPVLVIEVARREG